jgi:uncharacterized protein YjbI with pentapeptide repeats
VRTVGRKKLVRKAEPPARHGIAWPRWTGFRGMTVRDWLQLLVVPLALVVISLLFAAQQDQRQQNIEDQRAQQAQKIENQRAEAERELAVQSAQDEALKAYLDQMSGLILEKDLRESKEDSEVRTLARARTLTVLGRLDPSRKAAVMGFLDEANLTRKVDGKDPVIALAGADLSGVNLSKAGRHSPRYVGFTDLSGADMSYADMSGADMSYADMSGTDLSWADMRGADLRGADLRGANLSHADLSNADLSKADLDYAVLRHADMSNAVLVQFPKGKGGTAQQLSEDFVAKHLEGAIMPNGQKYEDWLKDREKRQQDE